MKLTNKFFGEKKIKKSNLPIVREILFLSGGQGVVLRRYNPAAAYLPRHRAAPRPELML